MNDFFIRSLIDVADGHDILRGRVFRLLAGFKLLNSAFKSGSGRTIAQLFFGRSPYSFLARFMVRQGNLLSISKKLVFQYTHRAEFVNG